MRRLRTLTVLCGFVAHGVVPLAAQQAPQRGQEVRQIVTFLFQPGRAAEATTIYESQLKPIYADLAPLRRFRAYREAESPEPLDLVVVSSYADMAGMDAANEGLRKPNPSGRSAFALYGTLAGMTQSHHDQFVEMLPHIGPTPDDSAGIVVFEYLRVPVANHPEYAVRLEADRRNDVTARVVRWSEAGRLLVSDGWDFLRIHHLRSLGDWQRYRSHTRMQTTRLSSDVLVTSRKVIILKQDGRLSVR